MTPDELDGLVIEVPVDNAALATAAAAGWLPPPKEKDADPVEVEVKDEKKEVAKPEFDADAVATIKRERDEAIERARRLEEEKNAEIAARDTRLTEVEEKVRKSDGIALRAHFKTVSGELREIETTIHSTQQMLARAEQQLAAANEQGEHGTAAKLQREIARAEAQMVQLEAGKEAATETVAKVRWHIENPQEEARPEVKKVEEKKEVKQPPSKDDWLADLGKKTSPKTVEWMKSHPEFMSDERLHKKFLTFANSFPDLEDKPLSSAEFVEALDAKFGFKGDVVDEEEEVAAPVVKKKTTPVAAPVSRTGKAVYSSRTPNGVPYLRPQLAQAAKEIGSDPLSYFNTVKQMIADGKYPKNYLDPDYGNDK